MKYWRRLQAWFQDNHGYDEYGVSAYNKLVEVRKYCYKRYGEDGDIVYEQIGKRLQYHIDAMNNQGRLHKPSVKSEIHFLKMIFSTCESNQIFHEFYIYILLKTLLIVKVVLCAYPIKPHGIGVSQAWQIMGIDEQVYLTKFNISSDRIALNELICNRIAKKFKLPVFEPVLINMNDEHCIIINEDRQRRDLPDIKPGKHFGVKLLEPFYSIEKYREMFESLTIKNLVLNTNQIPDIFGFDTLIQNNDRHCGNICILHTKPRSKSFRCFIFDHSHAFGSSCWSKQSIKKLYQNMLPIQNFCSEVLDEKTSGRFENFLRMFETYFKKEIDDIFQIIPIDWAMPLEKDLDQVRTSIKNISRNKLRDAIESNPLLGER